LPITPSCSVKALPPSFHNTATIRPLLSLATSSTCAASDCFFYGKVFGWGFHTFLNFFRRHSRWQYGGTRYRFWNFRFPCSCDDRIR
jgi:hypothetical protein